MYEDFEKQLTELMEAKINEIIKESKAKSIVEFANNELSVAKVNRTHNTKGLLMYLYMEKDFIPGLKLDARLKKYGLAKVFTYVCSDRNFFIEAYDNDEDLWACHIVNEFDDCLPLVD